MAKKPKKSEVETHSATIAEAKAGVRFGAGHPGVLILTDSPTSTTTAAPGSTTTKAPRSTTTVAPGSTTTKAPHSTTTAAPGSTTTKAPPPTTTAAPGSTTTKAPRSATTAAPGRTTTEPSPHATTTAAPPDHTTTEPSPHTTTTAAPPGSTTTKAPSLTTTKAPKSTTTKAPPSTTTKQTPTPSDQCVFADAHFDTDKTLPLAAALPTFKAIAAYANKNPKRAYLVIGHTDHVFTADHNLGLSAERAASIVAYLKNDADTWMAFYNPGKISKQWGTQEDQVMLSALPFGGKPYYARKPDGVKNADFTKAIRDFQRKQKIPETGTMDKGTRKMLVQQYQAAEGTSVPASLNLQTLACGFRHMVEDTQGASAKNRRVDLLAFESSPIVPDPSLCKDGKHPGCKVYDQWMAEVTGKIG